ncbi:MAG: alanine racemase [Candidatus Izemoplasmataceae bacterium]
MAIYRPTIANIHLDHITHNIEVIQKIIQNKSVIPVVKANAYGHGAIQVVEYLIKHGFNYFAVSLLEEALELREKFTSIDILVMGVIDGTVLKVCSDNNITITISDEFLANEVLRTNYPLKCHIKYDSGMNRLGFKSNKVVLDLVNKLSNKGNVNLEGLYTHFATSDSDESYYLFQLNNFKTLLQDITYKFPMLHVSNSSSAIKYEKDIPETTHVRLGISLYGLTLEKDVHFLKPVLVLKTKVVQIKPLKKNEYLGYGITYQAPKNELIGILPIGYADGFIRKNQNGFVQIHDKTYKIIGRICMDQTFIRIDESIKLNDEVLVMGSKLVTIDDVAKRLDTINYEVICTITNRVPRIYMEKENLYETECLF